jgi:signal transduction histidine kinase
MRDLVRASQALGQSLHKQDRLPLLDEQRGTLEVRESAQVFNAMARQLRRQFNERGLMVAAISHDLRTPLTRLRMRLETLDIEEIQRQRSVEDIREMNALVDAVMELFRGDGPGAAEPLVDVDLGALAQALTDDLIEQSMPVTFADGNEPGHAEPVLAKGQPMALRRVLGNLIGNAVRYGGSAEVRVGRDAQGVWLRVTDPGPGIPEDKLEAVFEPFYRLEESRNRHTGGAGLGLYIARELTLRQRGSLSLSNRPEGGLMAELRLTAT